MKGISRSQSRHLADISMAICRRIEKKYKKGQQEHGGDLWEKEGMMDNAMDEVSDLVTYLHTLRSQLEEARGYLLRGATHEGLGVINKILGPPND